MWSNDTGIKLIRTISLVACFIYFHYRYATGLDACIAVTVVAYVWGISEALQNEYRKVDRQETEISENDRKSESVDPVKSAILLCNSFLNEGVHSSDKLLWNTLLKHRGHDVRIVSYGDLDNPVDVCLECEDCGEVVLSAELYTICARSDIE